MPTEEKRYCVNFSAAISCALQLDDRAMRREYGIPDEQFHNAGRGAFRAMLTLGEIDRVAYHATREAGWDLPPQTISACNRFALKLVRFADETRRGSVPTVKL